MLLTWTLVSRKHQHKMDTWIKFQLCMSFDNQIMVLQVYRVGCVLKTPFHNSYIGYAWALQNHLYRACMY